MEPSTVNCQNCDEPFEEGFEFCPHCGQKTKDELTLGVLFYNTISNYFSFDARFFRSFIPLMFKPGYIAKEFVKGKRLQYLHPAQYYLFVSVIFFFILSFKVNEFNRAADEAFKKGAKYCVVDETSACINDNCLLVDDTLSSLQEFFFLNLIYFLSSPLSLASKTSNKGCLFFAHSNEYVNKSSII